MISELETTWKQLEETYAAIRESFAAVPEDRLHWCPDHNMASPAGIVQHICRANLLYCMVIERRSEPLGHREPDPSRATVEELLNVSESRSREILESLSLPAARESLEDDWNPLGPNVVGPLDAIWFANQIVRHSAYHLGQLNYVMQLGGFAIDYD